MIPVDLDDIEDLARDVAASLGKAYQAESEQTPQASSLILYSPRQNTARVTITTVEPGTLYLELPSGAQAEWLIKDETTRMQVLDQVQAILHALYNGTIEEEVKHCIGGFTVARATVSVSGKTIRMVRHTKPLPCVGRTTVRHYEPFPDVLS